MSDKPQKNMGELIPSIDRSLARKRSDLVKRGLELIHEQKKQQLQILIGNFDDPINDLFFELIKGETKNKYDLKVPITTNYGEEVLELAQSGIIDIFILIMNNLNLGFVDCNAEDRLENSLLLITQIKTIYGRPVIALLSRSMCLDPSLVTRAKIAADFFFPMPFKNDAFREAIEKCLDRLPGFDEVSRKQIKVSERPPTT